MRKSVMLALPLLACVFLDTAVLPRVDFLGIAPAAVFTLVAVYALVYSLQAGLACAAAGGLMVDLLCNTVIGLTPALYILALLVLAELTKHRTLKPLFVFLAVSALYFVVQFIFASGASLFGQVRPYGRELTFVQLPSAALTGVIAGILVKYGTKKQKSKS